MLVFVFYAKMLKILKIKKIIPCGTPDFISQSAIKISTLAIFYWKDGLEIFEEFPGKPKQLMLFN